jgi:uncharacterized protein
LIKKKIAGAKDAAEMFATADRADLKESEEAQIAVYEEYAGQVETMSSEDIRAVISDVVTQMKADNRKINIGTIMKNLLGQGKPLNGKPAERSEVSRIIKEIISEE